MSCSVFAPHAPMIDVAIDENAPLLAHDLIADLMDLIGIDYGYEAQDVFKTAKRARVVVLDKQQTFIDNADYLDTYIKNKYQHWVRYACMTVA